MKFIPAKTILTTTKSPQHWFNAQYNINLYRGCLHGCIYCDSRSDCYRVENFDELAVKEQAIAILEKELRGKRVRGIVGMGAMSDPYNHLEKELELTRQALQLIDRYGFGVYLSTKSPLVVRDTDILKSIAAHSPVTIAVTITDAADQMSVALEPAAPPSSVRFEALRVLSAHDLYAGVLMMPILPFITDTEENISALVTNAAQCQAKFIYPYFGVTLRNGQREYFYQRLDALYPGMSNHYRETYGNSYQCFSPHYRKLTTTFSKLCHDLNIKYVMQDIITGAAANIVPIQGSLF